MRRGVWVAVLAAVGLFAASAQANELIEITLPARNGEVSDQWLPRYDGDPRARVLLPDGYDPDKAYPLLLLLIGLNSNYTDWSDPGEGEIAKTAAGFPGIIVMPEGGDGWYADWFNGGKRGDPAWESYTLDQVIPQILERYKIRPQRRWHAIAGVSMGGLGTAYIGGRLPGFFGSAAVLSGLVDLSVYPSVIEGSVQSLIASANAGAPFDPQAVEGPWGGFYELGHDPVEMPFNMAQTRVFMASGDGTAAPDSGTGTWDQAAEGTIIHPASSNYAAALNGAGVDLVYQQHPGFHDWPNFRREFRDAVDWGLFKPVEEHATSWVNATVATHGELWEFSYAFDAPPDRVVRLRRNGPTLGVSAAGSPVTITTDGGCVFHIDTPGSITVPAKPCAKLRLRIRPRRVPVGRWTRVRAIVSPRVAGAVVRVGRERAVTNAHGVARVMVCPIRAGDKPAHAKAANRLPARATLRARGRRPDHLCPGVA